MILATVINVTRVRSAGAALVLGALVLMGAAGVAAEVRRLEAVGAVPVKPNRTGSASILDEAIQAALREAVSRVARTFLMDAEPAEGEDGEIEEEPSLEEVLGVKMVPYTTRFRITDDQGERPALFAEDPEVSTEYVVLVEVYVDADRVQERLIEAGLLRADVGLVPSHTLQLEVRGLDHYSAYEAMRALIAGPGGARSVAPIGFASGVAVFRVELVTAPPPRRPARAADYPTREHWSEVEDAVDRGGAELLRRLMRSGPPELVIRPLEVASDEIVVAAHWTPPDPAD